MSIHRRRSSIDEASSFFEKVQLHFQLTDLLVELVLICLGLLAHLFAAVAEDVRQTGQRLFLPAAESQTPPPMYASRIGSAPAAAPNNNPITAFGVRRWFAHSSESWSANAASILPD